MANRSFHKPLGSLEIDVVSLFGTITIGSSGAVSSSTGKGIASVALSGTGGYIVTLQDAYNALLFADLNTLHSTDSAASTVGIGSRINAADVSSAKTVTFQMYALDDGADANPASGAVLYVMIVLRNSSVT